MSPVRPIDRWFVAQVLPHESSYLQLARRLTGRRDEAQDLVQESYARLFALDGWAAILNPQAYVLRSIRHIAIERMRRAKIVDFQQLVEADHADLADDAPDPLAVAMGRDGLRRFSEALARLPERCREVFVRRRVQEQPPRQMAEELGVSLSTLEKRLARAFYLLAQQGVGGDDDPPGDESQQDVIREG